MITVSEDDDYDKVAYILRHAIAYELLMWAKTYDGTEIREAMTECAHRIARDERPPEKAMARLK